MADAPAVSSGQFGFLTKKLGPFPVVVWALLLAGVYLAYQHLHGSSSSTGTNASATAIDPSTGQPYASELAAQGQQIADLQQQGQQSPTGGFTDNATWGVAAVNFLVGVGIDPTVANQAIQLYLNGQNLTTAQQADVNLAIEAIGPPPQLPGPSSGNPPPVTNPGGGGKGSGGGKGTGGGTKTSKPAMPSNVRATHITSDGFTITWNKVTGATSYKVNVTYQGKAAKSESVSGTSATISGLTPDHTYTVHVAAVNSAGSSAQTNGPSVKTTR